VIEYAQNARRARVVDVAGPKSFNTLPSDATSSQRTAILGKAAARLPALELDKHVTDMG